MLRHWNLRTRARECCVTGRHFIPGEKFITAIHVIPGTDEMERKDYSLEGWKARDAAEPKPFSHWKNVFVPPPPPDAKPDPVSKATAEQLLRQLIEEDNPGTEKARYILTLMLERRKVLKPKGVRDTPDERILIYEYGKTGEVFLIRDPNLHLSEIESVRAEVSLWLGD